MFLRFKKRTDVTKLTEGEEAVVEGVVEARREMTVPGTQTKCVLYYLLAEAWQYGPRGRGRKMWVPSNQQLKTEGFFVNDGTGVVWVASAQEGIDLRGGTEKTGPIGKKGKARYLCRIVEAGDTVRVRGMAQRPKGAEPAEGLVIRSLEKGGLQVMFKKKGND